MPVKVDVKEMLEAGVHFGHQVKKWNPKMRPYIYTQRDGVHIIDLAQTSNQVGNAYKFIADTIALGNSVLFVGTKKQAMGVIMAEAVRAKQPYVCNRWLGGMLTNFKTIKASIDRLENLCARKEKGEFEKLTKKEGLELERQIGKLDFNLGGIRKMNKLPGAIFIVDSNEEHIAFLEAKKLGIPVVALIDTNANPDGIDYLIVGNDDAIRSVEYFTKIMADACEEGERRREEAIREESAKAEKEGPKQQKPALDKERKIGGKGRAYTGRKPPPKGKRGAPVIVTEDEVVPEKELEEFAKIKVETKETK